MKSLALHLGHFLMLISNGQTFYSDTRVWIQSYLYQGRLTETYTINLNRIVLVIFYFLNSMV